MVTDVVVGRKGGRGGVRDRSVQDKLPLAGVGYQTVKIETFYDPSAGVGTDAALTVV